MNGSCVGFICEGKDLRLYDPAVWRFLGKGEYGGKTFTFDPSLDTFVITYDGIMGFDALSGTTADGKVVPYGYLTDGRVSASYMDSSNLPCQTIIAAENNHQPITTPCGIIDPKASGDKSYNMTGGPGGIVFSFLDNPWGPEIYSTRKGYSLSKLTIVSQPASKISPQQICP